LDPAKRESKTKANGTHAKLLDNDIDKRRKKSAGVVSRIIVDRYVGEDPGNKREGGKNKYSILRNWDELETRRVISSDLRGLGAKLDCYTPRKKFCTKKII